jgi:hypothetical protein
VRGADRIWQYDGTNVYAITRVTRETTNAQEIARRAGFPISPIRPQNGDHIRTMTLTESVDGCPLGDVAVNIPWLAYCSGGYIKRPGRVIPKPVSTLSHDPEGFAFSDSTITFQDSLGLPRIVELRTAKVRRSESFRRFHDTHFSSRSPETLETTVKDGVLKFRYSVLQSTNLFGLQIPVSFVYEDYQIEGEGVAVLRYSGAGKVSAIRQTEQPKSPFSQGQSYTIVDTRFQDESKKVQAIVYSSNTLATTADPRLVATFSNWKANVPTTTNVGRNQSRVWVIRSVILFVVLVPIAMLALHKWFSPKSKNLRNSPNEIE